MIRICHFLLLALVTLNIYADPVNEEVALQAAKNFMLHYSRLKSTHVNLVTTEVKSYKSTATFYAFNNTSGGWILISANDLAIPVLAYSTTGEWDEASVNPTAQLWIESYSKEIYEAIQNGQPGEASRQEWDKLLNQQFSDAATTVAPLLATSWDQSKYYNDLCPASNEAPAGYGGRVPTGCVATAMAQIMKYYNYPATGVGSYSYTHAIYGAQSANFGNTDYNWAAMPVKAVTTSTALATLMYHCGVAVNMNYDPDGSGALSGDVPSALMSYFNYDNTIDIIGREDVGSDELWRSIIRTELDAKRPVYYSGSGSGGGHAFVCDGYDNSNPTKFHINWGWSGNSNGYFSIGALTTTNGAFNELNRIVIGIKPRTSPGFICRIENPANGANVAQGQDIKVSVKTLKGLSTKIVLFLDGVRIDSTTNTSNDFTLKTATLAPGEHRIAIKAEDGTNTNVHDIAVNILSTCWKPQNIALSVDSVTIEQIFPVDENVVWAVLKDISSQGRLLRKFVKTTDGGTTWTEGTVACTGCSTKEISNIYAFSGSKAYVCLNPGNALNGGAILVTEDGGATWTTQSSANFTNSWANWVYFFDANNGVCMGDSYKLPSATNYSFAIYTTSDGGKTWTAVGTDKLPKALDGEAGTVNFFDAVGSTIWFGTGSGRVYKSVDKGLNWNVKDGVLGAIQTNVRFRDANYGIAFGRYGYADYGFKKTTDGGATWTEAFPKGSISGQDYQFVPGTDSTWINSGIVSSVSITDNTSYSWLDVNTEIGTTKFLSPTSGWGGGPYTLRTGGGMYKWQGSFSPVLDTKLVVRLKDAAGNIIPDANVYVLYQTKTSDENGLAVFDVKSFGNPVSVSVSKTGYTSVAVNYHVEGEDTVDIILPQSGSVTFTVKNSSDAAISGATVIFNGQTLTTDANGTTTFTNVNKGLYPYAVTKSRYYAGYGTLNVSDASHSLNVTLLSDATTIVSKIQTKNIIFPNPASDILNILSENTITGIEIVSMTGQKIFSQKFASNTVQIPLSNISDGEYIINIQYENRQESAKIVVKK